MKFAKWMIEHWAARFTQMLIGKLSAQTVWCSKVWCSLMLWLRKAQKVMLQSAWCSKKLGSIPFFSHLPPSSIFFFQFQSNKFKNNFWWDQPSVRNGCFKRLKFPVFSFTFLRPCIVVKQIFCTVRKKRQWFSLIALRKYAI